MARIENWNPPELNINKTTYLWDVEYATAVHEGEITKDGNILPARPWTDYTIGQINAEQEFRQAYIDSEDLSEAFQDFSTVLFNEFHVSMASDVFSWPRETVRKSGEIASSPRNIFDLGNLYNSQSMEFSYE